MPAQRRRTGERTGGRTGEQTGGRVIVGIDDTPGGREALRWAVAQARKTRSELVAVRVWALGLPRHGGRRRHESRLHPHVVLYFDGVEQRVLGGRAGHDLDRLVHGSVSHYCCQHARCPVVVVPAPAGQQHSQAAAGLPGRAG